MADSQLERFLGDRPGPTILKLVFVSLIVGAALALMGLSPRELVDSLLRFVRSIWAMGFDAIHEVIGWVVAGAVIVVPVWLVARLLRQRNG
jgi:Na+/H+-dicarboxylate symporter